MGGFTWSEEKAVVVMDTLFVVDTGYFVVQP